VETFGKVRSMRKYQFERLGDGKVVARGETDWVLIDVKSGRPKPITDKIRACFLL
jgi:acyl-CoA thioester hydrolase